MHGQSGECSLREIETVQKLSQNGEVDMIIHNVATKFVP